MGGIDATTTDEVLRHALLRAYAVLRSGPDGVYDDLVSVLSQRLGGAATTIAFHDGTSHWAKARTPDAPAEWDDASGPAWPRTLVAVRAIDGTPVGAIETTADVPVGSATWHTLDVAAGLVTMLLEERRPGIERAPAPWWIVVVGTDGSLRAVSPALARMIGRTADELVGVPVFDLVHPADHGVAVENLARTAEFPGEKFPLDLRFLRVDGSSCLLEVTATFRDDPAVEDLVFVVREPTARHDSDTFVADQSRVLAAIGRGAPLDDTLREITDLLDRHLGQPAAIALVEPRRACLLTCAATGLPEPFVRAIDGAKVHAAGITPAIVAHRGQADRTGALVDDPAWHEAVGPDSLDDSGLVGCWSVPVTSSVARVHGSSRPLGVLVLFSRSSTPPRPEEVRIADLCAGLAGVAIERSRAEDVLTHQALHDALTGLPNRALFLDRLQHALNQRPEEAGLTAVMFLDLDRFKVINDALGHDAGDDLLIAVADRLRSVNRPSSTIARFGGDEFTVLCEHLESPRDAMAIAQRFVEVLREPLPLAGNEVVMSVSIGVAIADGTTDEPGALLRDADAAMYRAKERGRNRAEIFDDELRALAVARLDLEHALAESVDRGDFGLVYQPEYELRGGRVIGAEALLRWRHPSRGEVAPTDFIGIAEETGAITALGDWVFERACRQAMTYLGGGPSGAGGVDPAELDPSFTVWVNVSVVQLLQPDFPGRIERVLLETGVDPTRMGLEITESALMTDSDAAVAALHALKALGLGIAIDDFGTGYSSLSYLMQLPVDLVKIDRTFIERAGSDARATSIVGGIIRLAHAVGCRVIAEGVETEQQLAALVALGCDDAQGFHLAKPQPPDEGLRSRAIPAPRRDVEA